MDTTTRQRILRRAAAGGGIAVLGTASLGIGAAAPASRAFIGRLPPPA